MKTTCLSQERTVLQTIVANHFQTSVPTINELSIGELRRLVRRVNKMKKVGASVDFEVLDESRVFVNA